MTERVGLVGVLVATHGDAGAAMLMTVRGLVGAAAGFATIAVARDQPREEIDRTLRAAVYGLDQGAGVLVLCDLHGATPSNCAVELHRAGANVAVLCGVNLPMLLKLASMDRSGRTPAALAHVAAETAIRSIRLGEGGNA